MNTSLAPPLRIDPIGLDDIVDLRDRALSPGHPGRLVIWPYDHLESSRNVGLFRGDELIGCVSANIDECPVADEGFERQFRFHSMAIEPKEHGHGYGRLMLAQFVALLVDDGADLVWATARSSALGFYERFGMTIGETATVPETGFVITYITLSDAALAGVARGVRE